MKKIVFGLILSLYVSVVLADSGSEECDAYFKTMDEYLELVKDKSIPNVPTAEEYAAMKVAFIEQIKNDKTEASKVCREAGHLMGISMEMFKTYPNGF